MKDNKKFWDRFAGLYTKIQQKNNAEMYNTIARDISPYFTDDKSALELAIGSGQFTFSLYDKVRYYEATDYSENMIKEAKKVIDKGINYSVQDATHLTYSDKSFDVALIANALHIMPDPQSAMKEIHRVLSDDGVAIFPTFIYEGKVHKFNLWIMSLAGFKVFHKWDLNGYLNFIVENKFKVIDYKLYPSKIGPECVVIAKKI